MIEEMLNNWHRKAHEAAPPAEGPAGPAGPSAGKGES
jgi:hypothetical protein